MSPLGGLDNGVHAPQYLVHLTDALSVRIIENFCNHGVKGAFTVLLILQKSKP